MMKEKDTLFMISCWMLPTRRMGNGNIPGCTWGPRLRSDNEFSPVNTQSKDYFHLGPSTSADKKYTSLERHHSRAEVDPNEDRDARSRLIEIFLFSK